ncbi:hypothetical protein PILCRDRAFT_385172 [Piloderma croceum F 1598]|uniref:Uncharacterized protein n=1 Tax=Piloderma croceum (strain F 1598) TaxID=765440 RepID=A0A0C3C4E0_PILCF|nr:hypothetical protein PILCRDRAFT_385172 [Piloderma croceum F 1598]
MSQMGKVRSECPLGQEKVACACYIIQISRFPKYLSFLDYRKRRAFEDPGQKAKSFSVTMGSCVVVRILPVSCTAEDAEDILFRQSCVTGWFRRKLAVVTSHSSDHEYQESQLGELGRLTWLTARLRDEDED